MNDVDHMIRDALSADDAKCFDELDEQSMHEMIVASLRGKSRWLVAMVFAAVTVFTVLLIFTVVKFFGAEEPRELIAWAVAFLFCCLAVSMMKIWYWMELNKIAMTREIKRFELQLARLSQRVGKQQ